MKLEIEPTLSGDAAFCIEVWSESGKFWMHNLKVEPIGASEDEIGAANREIVWIVKVYPEMLAVLEGLDAALMAMETLDEATYNTIDDYLSENIIDLRKVITKARGRPKKEVGK